MLNGKQIGTCGPCVLDFVRRDAAHRTEESHLAIAAHTREHVEVLAQSLAPHARVHFGVFLEQWRSRNEAQLIKYIYTHTDEFYILYIQIAALLKTA